MNPKNTCACMLEPGRSHRGMRRGDIARSTVCESRHWCGRRDQIPSLMPHLSLAGRGCPSRLFSRHQLAFIVAALSVRLSHNTPRSRTKLASERPASAPLFSDPLLDRVATHSAAPKRPRARPAPDTLLPVFLIDLLRHRDHRAACKACCAPADNRPLRLPRHQH